MPTRENKQFLKRLLVMLRDTHIDPEVYDNNQDIDELIGDLIGELEALIGS